MSLKNGIKGLALTMAVVAASALGAPTSHAQPQPDQAQCLSAFDQAQSLRSQGKLIAAHKQLEICASAGCPAVVTSKCFPWLEEVTAALPSVVIAAQDHTGADVVDVKVTSDGTVLVESLDGRPIRLDPGAHKLRFERPGSPPIEQQIVAREGEKNRRLDVMFQAEAGATPPPTATATGAVPSPDPPPPGPEPAPTTPDEADSGGISPLVWVGFGVAGVGLIVGGITGGLAMSKGSELDDQCAGEGCTQDDIDGGMVVAHVSTASFVIAGAGAAVGLVGLLIGGSSEPEEAAGLELEPIVGPGSFGLRGRF
ncbi:MAG: hypothetical protein JRI68_14510 [Deltaproteobacteria bacterium]|nr:hypothetical protein [Deltaproteobacteria bacterium]